MTIEQTAAWLEQLRERRDAVRNNPSEHQLDEPQCGDRCFFCNLACAMATTVIANVEADQQAGTVH